MMVRAVLFDLDGTLADTAPDLAGALNRLRAERDLPPMAESVTRPLTSSGARGMLRAGFGIAPGAPDYEPMKRRFLDLYGAHLCEATRLFPGMPALLHELEARDIVWGIVTNKTTRFTLPLVAALNLHSRAACVVSGDTAARPKPAPDPLFYAARVISLPPGECVYVGDDLRDIEAARAAGMGALAAAWGYLGDAGPPETWGADAVIATPVDLLRFLGTTPSEQRSE